MLVLLSASAPVTTGVYSYLHLILIVCSLYIQPTVVDSRTLPQSPRNHHAFGSRSRQNSPLGASGLNRASQIGVSAPFSGVRGALPSVMSVCT
ncbi:MAG: hypothetical protein J07HN4v3_01968 [Halonotius sp. J07HN4]|nr:MAG: hypothetical protein J07HN4v3_01968 [Halonotius sp. J07HN4]